MDKLVINATIRTTTGKRAAKKLRATGRIPAVMYDSKGVSTLLAVDEVEFNKVCRAITPTTLISLTVDGQSARNAFIQDTEYNIRTDKVLHADFFELGEHQKITATMKVTYTGTPAGVLKGGFMVKHLPEVKVVAEPKNLPSRIEADVSGINIGEVYRVKDLNLGDGVTILTDAETALVSIASPR